MFVIHILAKINRHTIGYPPC